MSSLAGLGVKTCQSELALHLPCQNVTRSPLKELYKRSSFPQASLHLSQESFFPYIAHAWWEPVCQCQGAVAPFAADPAGLQATAAEVSQRARAWDGHISVLGPPRQEALRGDSSTSLLPCVPQVATTRQCCSMSTWGRG